MPIRRRRTGVSRESIHPGKLLPKQLSRVNFRDLIFDSKVDAGMPSLAAAPDDPDTLP
jgi:hypothetical protein